MISESVKGELRSIVGEKWFLDTPEDLATYSYDAFLPEFTPDGVILPATTDEVSRIMRVVSREKIPVTPRGAGTNICGGSVAKKGGIVMAFNRMNRILEVDAEDMCATVQPGVVNADLQKKVAANGLMYPPDPASMFVSTIGGNVALNAGGPRAVKYGVTRDYVLGLEVVLPAGRRDPHRGKVPQERERVRSHEAHLRLGGDARDHHRDYREARPSPCGQGDAPGLIFGSRRRGEDRLRHHRQRHRPHHPRADGQGGAGCHRQLWRRHPFGRTRRPSS